MLVLHKNTEQIRTNVFNFDAADFLSWGRDSGWSIIALMFWIIWNWQVTREIVFSLFH